MTDLNNYKTNYETYKHSSLNVDPEEIAKFESMSNQWWDPLGPFKPLHNMNPVRLNYIEQCCGNLANQIILDVGCGGGILSESMACRGASVTGIDMGEAPLEVAKIHSKASDIEVYYQKIQAEVLAEEKPETFDVITCMEVLEHVPYPFKIVEACSKMLKPGGHAFFSTISRNPKAWLFAIAGAEYLLGLLPRGTHSYKKFIRPHELSRKCHRAGLFHLNSTGLIYNPVTQKFKLSSNDLSVNYIIHTRKFRKEK